MSRSRTNSGSGELLVELRRETAVPLHQQLESGIRERIRQGLLRADTVMPSTRALATDLGLSRGVVVEAYQQLVAEGYLVSRTGGYTQVAPAAARTSPQDKEKPAPTGPPRIDFKYSRPDVSQFPRAAWLRSIRRVLNETPHLSFAYLDGRGADELRTALSDYLNRVRGTSARPENMLVCNGFAQGSRLLLQVLAASGYKRLAVEDPSDNELREVATAAGLEAVGVPVLESGLDVGALERSGADAVLVTAAHQFPTGAVTSAETRAALVEWAARRDALIIEDDYDAEYRYDREPIGAMQGLAPDRVVYAGTASKTLAPGLRLGWLILPARLVEPMAAAKIVDDRGSPVLDQLTFADFVARGEFDRHLRRMRPRYRRLRDALVGRLAERLPDLEPIGVSAGLHVMAWLPADVSESAVTQAARERGLGVYGLKPYWVQNAGPEGLVFGYGGLTEPAVVEGIDLLADTIASLRR
ncbi:GntR family transcriptional regulator/MocR family aminotransferase [Kribbella orskensis]|uniref:GntR family transcriptional regulator/MocR family aminotransferase n=1 Tax=Kribbella orskensis TaxID=2512216 RepID=A0ABY2B8M0_9ACTN|nr:MULTISPECIES: PLP-dependent aminotransferase family protein [Kribbella]TCN31539.1 GntR family transcriptional regulator/MocR family aminotransferase [Kribbella sp. VKM Ac-2500]TCO11884.1 GntR family transcriptional regulator/MocR family aminotransferase [Kribbella orskensis]